MEAPIILTYNIFVDKEDIKSGCLMVAQKVRPIWNRESIKFKFSEISKKVIVVINEDLKDAIVLKLFGKSTNYTNRTLEIITYQGIGMRGFGAEILCLFENGICLKYSEGKNFTLDRKSLKDLRSNEKICRSMARSIAEFHSVRTQEIIKQQAVLLQEPQIVHFMKKLFYEDYPDLHKLEDESKINRLNEELPNKTEIENELQYLVNLLGNAKMETTFGSIDFNPTNFIYNEIDDKCYMIDFKFCNTNYVAAGIASHIGTLWYGLEPCPHIVFPPDYWMIPWIKEYLKIAHKERNVHQRNKIKDSYIEKLHNEIKIMLMVYNFFMVLFVLSHCVSPKSLFPKVDDITFAGKRLEFHYRIKDEIYKDTKLAQYIEMADFAEF